MSCKFFSLTDPPQILWNAQVLFTLEAWAPLPIFLPADTPYVDITAIGTNA